MGEVVGPDGGPLGAGLEVDGHGDLARPSGRRSPGRRAASTAGRPRRRSSRRRGRPGRTRACVVPMLASTRPQLGSLPKTAALNRLLRATLRPTSTASSSVAALSTVIAISWSAPSASREQLHREVGARLGERLGEVRQRRRDPAGAAGQHGHGVVGRHAAVGVEPVEADPGRGAQRGVEVGGRDDGVGGEHDQHRGQRGREHAGALGHPADRPAGALDDDLLADRVGGHDRRRPRRCAAVGRERVVRRVDAGEQLRRGRW